MYKSLIENYMKRMNYQDVQNYVKKNYPEVSEEEIKVIYKYLKNRWEEIYDEKQEVLDDLKKEVSEETYKEIIKLLKTALNFKNR